MKNSDVCFVNEAKKMKSKATSIFYLIIWAIFFILGFSSISDLFLIPIKSYLSFMFTKVVSGEKKYRANYMENDKTFGYENHMKLKNINDIKDDTDDKKDMLISLNEYN